MSTRDIKLGKGQANILAQKMNAMNEISASLQETFATICSGHDIEQASLVKLDTETRVLTVSIPAKPKPTPKGPAAKQAKRK